MGKDNGYTHGGNPLKSLGLLLRSLMNLVFFGLLWFGLTDLAKSFPPAVATGCLIAGAAGVALCLVWNFFGPMIHRKK